MGVMHAAATHGGPDGHGAARWDFSTNANACGPAPDVLRAVQAADPKRYPDPACTALRRSLGDWHGVPAERIVIGASASELIMRLTAAMAHSNRAATVWSPTPGYSDYARAAAACGLLPARSASAATLRWHTAPGSPFGEAGWPPLDHDADGAPIPSTQVVDCAYEPLRLDDPDDSLFPARRGQRCQADSVWQLWSPNKALGLTGVRGAYAIAPASAGDLLRGVEALAPSWPLGAQGVAMLVAWTAPETQAWLARSLDTLRAWKQHQLALCTGLGWRTQPSVTPYFVARWADDVAAPPATVLPRLRSHGVQLRDTASMGLPGAVRLSVQPPSAQRALRSAWQVVTHGNAVGFDRTP